MPLALCQKFMTQKCISPEFVYVSEYVDVYHHQLNESESESHEKCAIFVAITNQEFCVRFVCTTFVKI